MTTTASRWRAACRRGRCPGCSSAPPLRAARGSRASAAEAAGVDLREAVSTQRAWGADAEYSRDHYLVRAEAIVSDWQLPVVVAPAIDEPLRAVSAWVEGRYRLRPASTPRRASIT